MLPEALHTQLCNRISTFSCLPFSHVLGLLSLRFWKGPCSFLPQCRWACYSLSLGCPWLCLVNSSSSRPSSCLWGSAACPLPHPSQCHLDLGHPWSGALILYSNGWFAHPAWWPGTSLRKRPSLAHVYTVVLNREHGTHLVFKKHVFGKRKMKAKARWSKPEEVERLISGESGQDGADTML